MVPVLCRLICLTEASVAAVVWCGVARAWQAGGRTESAWQKNSVSRRARHRSQSASRPALGRAMGGRVDMGGSELDGWYQQGRNAAIQVNEN
eukprot:COSAG02_NODE_14618_length_1254_cov_1.211255_1_plen_91_part_10